MSSDTRLLFLSLGLGLLMQACSTPRPGPEKKADTQPVVQDSKKAEPRKPQSPKEKPLPPGAPSAVGAAQDPVQPQYPRIMPVDRNQGRVASVNERLRFVVVDYSLSPMPKIGQRVYLYRDGAKTGELRIAGPSMGTTIIADLLQGDAKIGDLARED